MSRFRHEAQSTPGSRVRESRLLSAMQYRSFYLPDACTNEGYDFSQWYACGLVQGICALVFWIRWDHADPSGSSRWTWASRPPPPETETTPSSEAPPDDISETELNDATRAILTKYGFRERLFPSEGRIHFSDDGYGHWRDDPPKRYSNDDDVLPVDPQTYYRMQNM